MKYPTLLLCLVLFAGCATTPVYLRHPQTGQIAKCGPYAQRIAPGDTKAAAERERGCIEDCQRQGYERMAEPPKE